MDRKDELEFDLSKIMQEFSSQAPPAPLTDEDKTVISKDSTEIVADSETAPDDSEDGNDEAVPEQNQISEEEKEETAATAEANTPADAQESEDE